MPIDFTRLYGTAGPSSRGASPVSADMQLALGLGRGQVVSAAVSKVASAEALHGQWLKGELNLPQAKLPVADNPPPQTVRQAQAPDPALQALLGRQALYVVALAIKGHTLVTVTDQLLHKGQQVQVQLNTDNRLQLLPPRPAGLEPLAQPASPTDPALRSTPNNTVKPPPVDEIKQVLRQLLPEQGRPALLNAVNQWQQGLRHLPDTPPVASLRELLAELALRPIPLKQASSVSGPTPPTTPATESSRVASGALAAPPPTSIKAAIEQSGVLLEPRLAAALNNQVPKAQISGILNTDTKALLLRIASLSAPEALAGLLGQARHDASGSSPLPATAPAPATGAAANLAAGLTGAKPTVAEQPGLPGLLQLLATTPPASSEMRTLQIQLVTLLHQQTLANLARVRLGQLSPDNPRVRGGELPASMPTALTMDIPVRHDGEIHLVKMIIEEEQENPEQEQDKKSPAEKIWQVKLHLDTQSVGAFYAHLKFLRNTLSIDFWSEQANVLSEAREKFTAIKEALAAAGIDVSQVKYHCAEPAQSGNRLGYFLVDINT